jgi:hypothetical protein
MRKIVDLKGLAADPNLPFNGSENKVRKLMKHHENPLPFKRVGERGKYLFDVEAVYRWFDRLPGVNHTV